MSSVGESVRVVNGLKFNRFLLVPFGGCDKSVVVVRRSACMPQFSFNLHQIWAQAIFLNCLEMLFWIFLNFEF